MECLMMGDCEYKKQRIVHVPYGAKKQNCVKSMGSVLWHQNLDVHIHLHTLLPIAPIIVRSCYKVIFHALHSTIIIVKKTYKKKLFGVVQDENKERQRKRGT